MLLLQHITCTCFSVEVDVSKSEEMRKIVKSTIGTKFINKWADLACDMAIKSVATVSIENTSTGRREIDIKKYAKVEKV